MKLTQQDRANLIDALQEWAETIGPKELGPNETGLNSDRYDDIMHRLQNKKGCPGPKGHP